ncbi:MAG: hypothetical protein V1886_01415 [archaeon]
MSKISDYSKRNKNAVILAAILIFLLIAVYLNFFYSRKCADESCFNSALSQCKKARFLNIQADSSWLYSIKGQKAGNCIVDVKNIDVKIAEAELLKGKSMICSLPKGVVVSPESELGNCHGLLKESLQDIILERLHTYIVQNIGQIASELEKPIV